jgi:uncharacterized protein (UPF0335 family)
VPIVLPLVALDVLVLVLWTIAIALAIALVMRKVGDVFRPIPVVGGHIAGAVDSVAQVISNAAGSLEHGADRLAGAAWHQLARYMDHLWTQLVAHSGAFVQMAQELLRHAHALARLRALVHKAVGQAEAFIPRVKTLEREWHGIEHRVKALERDLATGIGHDLRIEVKALDREVTGLEHKVIPSIRAAENALAHDISALGEYIRSHFLSSATDAITAAVAVGLAALGLAGLRCSNFRSLLSRFGCGLGTLLNDLLGLVIAGIFLEGVCEFLPLIEGAFGAVVGPITHLLNEVPLGACESRPSGWATLSVDSGPLPPAQTLGPLAQ